MAIKYTVTYKKWCCPNCKKIVNKRTESDIFWIFYLMLPILLIIKLVYVIYSKKYIPHTRLGEKIIICKNCGKHLVLIDGFIYTKTRLMHSKKEMLNFLEPVLKVFRDYNINYNVFKIKKNIEEDIHISYYNNGKIVYTEIYIKNDSYYIVCDGVEYEYSHQHYQNLILTKLCVIK